MTFRSEKSFTAADVAERAGVPPATLRSWRARGLVKVESGTRWTRYTTNDLRRILHFIGLIRRGFTPRFASETAFR